MFNFGRLRAAVLDEETLEVNGVTPEQVAKVKESHAGHYLITLLAKKK